MIPYNYGNIATLNDKIRSARPLVATVHDLKVREMIKAQLKLEVWKYNIITRCTHDSAINSQSSV